MQKFLAQGSNLYHCSNLSHSSECQILNLLSHQVTPNIRTLEYVYLTHLPNDLFSCILVLSFFLESYKTTTSYLDGTQIYHFLFFLFWLCPKHMEVPRPETESKLQLRPTLEL